MVQRLARDLGETIGISTNTLHKRLHERGVLRSVETARGVLTVRRTLEGRRRDVLHLDADALAALPPSEADQPDQGRDIPPNPWSNCWSSAGAPSITNPTTEATERPALYAPLVGLVGSNGRREGGAVESLHAGAVPATETEEIDL